MQKRSLKIEGHRGAITKHHENTMEAFLEADRLKIDGIEFDLWLTKDRVPVITHGKTSYGLEVLTSPGSEKLEFVFIPQASFADLKQYVYPNSQSAIPSFEEMLLRLKDSPMYLNLELKDRRAELIEEILLIIKRVQPSVAITFSSFDHSLRAVIDALSRKHGLPRFPFGYLADVEPSLPALEEVAAVMLPKRDSINIDVQFVLQNNLPVKDYLKDAAARGFVIKCYNLMILTAFENETLYNSLIDYGVETFICNSVERLKEFNERPL